MPTYVRADARLDLRLPQPLADDVRAVARAEGESLGSVIRRALRQLVAEHKRREEGGP